MKHDIFFTGFADEAGTSLETQLRATKELGWHAIEMRAVQVPGFDGGNLHDIPEPAFQQVLTTLDEAGVRVNSLGSTLGNWAAKLSEPFDRERETAQRAANRARRLKADFIRVMSYPVGDPNSLNEPERFRRLREIVAIFRDSGTTVVHENCGNYGAMGWPFSLKLLENVPGLKLVFDMGNCAGDLDYTKPEPRPRQNAWEFFSHVKPHVAYVHVKDAILDPQANKKKHVYPGEGQCFVREILSDLLTSGYTGGISIEPHMNTPVNGVAPTDDEKYKIYVTYGQRLMKLIESL